MSITARSAVVVLLTAACAAGSPGPAAAETSSPPAPVAAPAEPGLPTPPAETEPLRRRVGDKLAIGTSLNVAAGELVVGSAVCIGCRGRIDGAVSGDIVVIGGKMEIAGSGGGQLVAVGSKIVLEPEARIGGDVVNVGGRVTGDDTHVGGQIVDLGVPAVMLGSLGGVGGLGGALGVFDVLFGVWWTIFTCILLVIAVTLLTAFVPERIRRMAEEIPVVPGQAFLWGLLAYVALPFTLLLLLITCIGIPIIPFVYAAFVVLRWLGMAAIFFVVGRRIGRLLNRDMSLLGGILLGLIPLFLLRLVPCVGWIFWILLKIFAIGYVIATRAGAPPREASLPAPVPPAPPAIVT